MRIKLLLLLLCVFTLEATACTIVSGTDRQGQTWALNNEDFFHTASNYVNVFPAQNKNVLGYITLTYGSPESSMQGGVNEAGLFFDINALPPPQNYKLSFGKKPFPHGNMLEYMLQHCRTVPEFLALWDTYYMPDMGDQIHLADKHGNLAVIAPDTILRATKQLTSTNFNVCATGPAKQSCWRYPLAQQLLAKGGVSQANFVQIAAATSQREFTTSVYTNIHNLSTGEIWFYLAEEYQTPWHTSVPALLKQGPQHILLTSQFPRNASRRLAQVMQTQGTTDAVSRFLQADRFSASEKESQLRMAFLNNFYIDKDFTKATVLFPLWERYMHTNNRLDSTEVQFTKAEVLAVNGKNEEAIEVLKAVKKPSWKTDALLANLRNTEEANAVIDLTGYSAAKAVVVEIKGDYNFLRFMQKTPTGWRLRLKSDRKELKYCFYIEGKRVVNSAQPVVQHQETAKGDYASFNVLKL
ncbi:carcinine hydrolase/isopenicillin-N N-acyltransferase family protein [uncultured Hymenobacter sp.]|uniref:carcinine hydrolase/isopenicillin-N N-acyltransferase family protein n=1 Tax=uncultured Hymenobacter sp. TaxID=170016 RepID=UPI0035CA98CE